MKTFFEDPTLRLVLFDMRDVLTSSENPDEDETEDTTPMIPISNP